MKVFACGSEITDLAARAIVGIFYWIIDIPSSDPNPSEIAKEKTKNTIFR